MKLIFLDVDGVLNHDTLFEERHHAWLGMPARERMREQVMPELCARLRRLVDTAHGDPPTPGSVWVVVSSSWRSKASTLEVLKERLFEEGIPVHDVTPDYHKALELLEWPNKMSMYYLRGTEIHAYLETWKKRMRHIGEVTNFVILDDNSVVGAYERQRGADYLQRHFVKTNPSVGLTDENVDEALRILTTSQQ